MTCEETLMYVPQHFQASDDDLRALLDRGAGDLITVTDQGLLATFLPFLYDAGPGDHGVLVGHLARNNDQWKRPAFGEALVILHGPDAYVSPSFYPSRVENPRVVPTWNYLTAHVYGTLVVHDDVEWLRALVTRLTETHEAYEPVKWSIADAPEAHIEGQLRAIVGVELQVTRVEVKAKMSQNRPAVDVPQIIDGLTARGDIATADAVRAANAARGLR